MLLYWHFFSFYWLNLISMYIVKNHIKTLMENALIPHKKFYSQNYQKLSWIKISSSMFLLSKPANILFTKNSSSKSQLSLNHIPHLNYSSLNQPNMCRWKNIKPCNISMHDFFLQLSQGQSTKNCDEQFCPGRELIIWQI